MQRDHRGAYQGAGRRDPHGEHCGILRGESGQRQQSEERETRGPDNTGARWSCWRKYYSTNKHRGVTRVVVRTHLRSTQNSACVRRCTSLMHLFPTVVRKKNARAQGTACSFETFVLARNAGARRRQVEFGIDLGSDSPPPTPLPSPLSIFSRAYCAQGANVVQLGWSYDANKPEW